MAGLHLLMALSLTVALAKCGWPAGPVPVLDARHRQGFCLEGTYIPAWEAVRKPKEDK